MEEKKRNKFIQIPYSLIINTKPNKIPHQALYLYIYLKTVCKNNIVQIYSSNLKNEKYLDWKDNRTLKKYLEVLKKNEYINYEFEKIPQLKPMKIEINKIEYKDFIQVDTITINEIKRVTKETPIKNKSITKIVDLKEMSIRLYCYYIKNFNMDWKYACPKYEDISKDTGIGFHYIKSINSLLSENKILKIKIGVMYMDKDDHPRQEVNEYKPILWLKNRKN